jgi:hypothetical protein
MKTWRWFTAITNSIITIITIHWFDIHDRFVPTEYKVYFPTILPSWFMYFFFTG